jgi:hypothetical protein
MLKVSFLIPLFAVVACAAEVTTSDSLPQSDELYTQDPEAYYEAQQYMNDPDTDPSLMINEANAFQVTTFENTPQSVVAYFYASIIRKDQEWQKVCLPYDEQTPGFKKTIDQYNTWRNVTYVPQPSYSNDILFSLEFTAMNGEEGHGDRVITVEEIDGKYLITEIPAF